MKVAILGAGQQARGVLYYLNDAENIEAIVIADHNEDALRDLIRPYLPDPRIQIVTCDANSVVELTKVLTGCDTAISCLPYSFSLNVTYAAIKAKCNLVDLGGNNDIVKKQFSFGEAAIEAGVTIIPDCGLAPGLVSLLVANAYEKMGKVNSVSIKVGGLPNEQMATFAGPLQYSKVFSTQGLWNEYVQPAIVRRDGQIKEIPSLTECYPVTIQGTKLEAFVTSGGISTLPTSFESIDNIEYKTLRYPGHYNVLRTLKELDQLTVENLDRLIKPCKSDVVFGQVRAIKTNSSIKHCRTYEFIVRPHFCNEYLITISAMAQATAFPATILALMLPYQTNGVLRQETNIDSDLFIKTLTKSLPIQIVDHIEHEV